MTGTEEHTTWKLSDASVVYATELIKKFNKKAAKLGFPEVVLKEIEVVYETTQDSQMKYKRTICEINYPEIDIKIEGWSFVAIIEPQKTGKNLVKTIPGIDQDLPEEYREANLYCDHCHVDRYRKQTYIITDGKDWKQVGSTCIRDFTGHKNPHSILAYIQALQDLPRKIKEIEEDSGSGGSGGSQYVEPEVFMDNVVAIAETDGYVSKSAAMDGKESTANKAIDSMSPEPIKDRYGTDIRIKVTEEHKELSDKIMTWAKEHYSSIENPNDYEWNLATLLELDMIDLRKHTGYIASVYVNYKKQMESQIEKKDAYLGEVDQVLDLDCKVFSTMPLQTQYGVTYLTKFEVNGLTCVAFISYTELEPGETYHFKAVKIEEHSQFKNEAQTKIKISFRKKVNKEQINNVRVH